MIFKPLILKKRLQPLFLSFLLGQIAFSSAAQSVQIMPLQGLNEYFFIDQLWDVLLLNSTAQPMTGVLDIQMTQGSNHAAVFSAVSAPLTLKTGNNKLDAAVRAKMTSKYAKTAAAMSLQQTGKLPFGIYSVCYTFRDVKLLTRGNWCQEKTIRPLSPPELMNPMHKEVVETVQPILVWRAPFPLQAEGLEYNVRLTEVPQGMNPAEALRTRAPHLTLSHQRDPFLPYPSTAKPLQTGKTYVWQVSALSGNFDLGVTDLWTFSVKTPVVAPVKKQFTSYCWVKTVDDGSYCHPIDSLKFVYQNNEGEQTLQYRVVDQSNEPLATTFPVLKLISGANALILPLNKLGKVDTKQFYRLEVVSKTGERFILPFKRRDSK
jgi:hypothetical protein